VFYVCHDPAVIVKHSEDLTQFIEHINDFGKNAHESHLDIVHEKVVIDIWSKSNCFLELDDARVSNDINLKDFAFTVPDNFVIADLRNKPIKSGFAWGKFGPRIDSAKRHGKKWIFIKIV
jgi:hypothetical protein